MLILTGARRGEVLSATWDQFDLQAGVWVKPSAHTKQKREYRVPLSAPMLALLTEMREEAETTYLFPARDGKSPLGDIKKSWAAICSTAGIRRLRIHDLRHSYASQLASAGLSLSVIEALLGHTQAQTTQRYAHLLDAPLRAATERVGVAVEAAANGGKGAEVAKLSKRAGGR
jgi:integrase